MGSIRSSEGSARVWLLGLLGLLAIAGVTVLLLALLTNLFERKQEARQPFVRLVEVTEHGLWFTRAGVVYFLGAAAATVAVVALVLTKINRRTSDLNLRAQRRLQIRKRAERLAAAERGA